MFLSELTASSKVECLFKFHNWVFNFICFGFFVFFSRIAVWAMAVEFYKVFFSETLPEVEAQPREWLIVDFLKKCWSVVGQRHPALMTPVDVVIVDDACPFLMNEAVQSIF